MTRSPVLLAGATPLVTALGVRLARVNWPVAGLWDPDHARALTASLRVGCCAFPDPVEPLGRAGYVLLGLDRPAWLAEGVTVIATWAGSGEPAWLAPREPGLELLDTSFDAGGMGHDFALELGLTCSTRQV